MSCSPRTTARGRAAHREEVGSITTDLVRKKPRDRGGVALEQGLARVVVPVAPAREQIAVGLAHAAAMIAPPGGWRRTRGRRTRYPPSMWRWGVAVAVCGSIACAADPPSLPDATSVASAGSSSTGALTSDSDTTPAADGIATSAADDTASTSAATTEPATTTGPPVETACSKCAELNCAEALAACTEPTACTCWLSCMADNADPAGCDAACGPQPAPVARCAAITCHDQCEPGLPTIYEPCGPGFDPCPPGLYCANAPRHCTFECVDTAECPPQPPESTSPPVCDAIAGGCVLDCSGPDATCPTGLGCAVFNIELCAE